MYVVACYDITDNRRRARLYELLLGYGAPVQKSVFECNITARQFTKMKKMASHFAKRGDSIRYYELCVRCQRRTLTDGTKLADTGIEEDFVV